MMDAKISGQNLVFVEFQNISNVFCSYEEKNITPTGESWQIPPYLSDKG